MSTEFDQIFADDARGVLMDTFGQSVDYVSAREPVKTIDGILTQQADEESTPHHDQVVQRGTLEISKADIPAVYVGEDYVDVDGCDRWIVLGIAADEGGMWTLRVERIDMGAPKQGRRY